MKIADLISSRVSATVATVALAIVGLAGNSKKPWNWKEAFSDGRPWGLIIALAVFLVWHSWVKWRKESQKTLRIAGDREIVQSNLLHLISDLSSLAGRKYDLWIVDMYLERNIWGLVRRWPYFTKGVLDREVSLSLSDVSKLPGRIEIRDNLFSRCFGSREPKLWWDPDVAQTTLRASNCLNDLDDSENATLTAGSGVIKIWPIVDKRGLSCSGIVVVHASRDTEVATNVLGVLAGGEADRFLARSSENIYNQLGK